MEKVILSAVMVLCLASPEVMAWTQFNDGATHDINYAINDDVWVDWQSPGMGTTVNLQNGAEIMSTYEMRTFENSVVNMYGGSVYAYIAYDSSRLDMSDGGIYRLELWDSSQATISGGSIYTVDAFDNNQVTIAGGSVQTLVGGGDSQIDISMGNVVNLRSEGYSQVTISGGSMDLHARGHSQVTVYGGATISSFLLGESAEVTLWGGLMERDFFVDQESMLTIRGSNFAVDGTPLGYGSLQSVLGGLYYDDPHRRLTGTLSNGDPIDNDFLIGATASIVLTPIPEPSTLCLVGLAVVIGMFRRWRG